jgi:hypothetical protein
MTANGWDVATIPPLPYTGERREINFNSKSSGISHQLDEKHTATGKDMMCCVL